MLARPPTPSGYVVGNWSGGSLSLGRRCLARYFVSSQAVGVGFCAGYKVTHSAGGFAAGNEAGHDHLVRIDWPDILLLLTPAVMISLWSRARTGGRVVQLNLRG